MTAVAAVSVVSILRLLRWALLLVAVDEGNVIVRLRRRLRKDLLLRILVARQESCATLTFPPQHETLLLLLIASIKGFLLVGWLTWTRGILRVVNT